MMANEFAYRRVSSPLLKDGASTRLATFGEILEVFAEYIEWEAERDCEIEPAYEAVAKLLRQAAQAAKKPPSSLEECSEHGVSKRVEQEARVTTRIANHVRRRLLLKTVSCWFRGLQAEKYHTSQLLAVLSEYVEAKKRGEEDDFESWVIVAQILKDAAAAAQVKDKELP